jgi:predicted secreted protein
MQFVFMFGVMLILPILCLFVLLRLAVSSRESEDHPVPGISSPRQVVPLITFIYPIIFCIIILACIGLILMGPNRSP